MPKNDHLQLHEGVGAAQGFSQVEEAFDACEEFMQVAALPILGVGLLGHAVDGDAQVGQAGKDELVDFFFAEDVAAIRPLLENYIRETLQAVLVELANQIY